MEKRELANENIENGEYKAKKHKKFNILAFIICMLVAVLIWCYAKGTAIKNGNISVDAPSVTENVADANT
jgi:cytosine/uracil/thiamine/allantoin permease